MSVYNAKIRIICISQIFSSQKLTDKWSANDCAMYVVKSATTNHEQSLEISSKADRQSVLERMLFYPPNRL